eukprot:2219103-Rhodomonas_salina.1
MGTAWASRALLRTCAPAHTGVPLASPTRILPCWFSGIWVGVRAGLTPADPPTAMVEAEEV